MKHTVVTAAALADRFLTAGDTVLDIGAADGEHTRAYAQRVGPTGMVLAVEPHDGHLSRLEKQRRQMPWITIWPGAVSSAEGDAVLHTDRVQAKCSSLFAENVGARGESYPVPVTTVDALVQQSPRVPKLIQVDAQGAEAAILRGATKTLALPCVWVLELWPSGLARAGATVADVLDPFEAHGYSVHDLNGRHLEWDEARRRVAERDGGAHHLDLVMVPEDLMEADW